MPRRGTLHQIGIIYGLVDPITNEIRYVGQTLRSLEERLRDHLQNSNLKIPCPKNTWILSLTKKGLKPGITIIEKASGWELIAAEKHWIETYRLQDCGLTNQYPHKDMRAKWLTTFKNVEVKPKAAQITRQLTEPEAKAS